MTQRVGALFPDPRVRSPVTVSKPRAVPFVRSVEVRTDDAPYVDLTMDNFKPFLLSRRVVITRIAGLVEDPPPDGTLRVWTQPQLVFECDMLLLSLRRLNKFTKISPGILVDRDRSDPVLRIEAEKPMMVWLSGAYEA